MENNAAVPQYTITEITAAKYFPGAERLVVDVFGLTYAAILMCWVVGHYLRAKRSPSIHSRASAA